jgi:drug/metabolite transporter (DMT)-like permease
MNAATVTMILLGVLLNAAAQLMLKAGASAVGTLGQDGLGVVAFGMGMAGQPLVLGGLSCHVLGVLIWMGALSRVDVSVAYPMLSLGYVINAVAAWYLLGEALTMQRALGIAVILVGVVVVARS